MKYDTSLTIIVFFSSFFTLSIGIDLPNDDIAIVRQRVLELMIWPATSDIPSVTNDALHFVSTLNRSCFWPDINYHDKSIVVWDTANHMHRITTMLQALTVNGSLVQNNTDLPTAIHCAINVWLTNDWQDPNWWFNQIDIPLHATSQLLMLNNNVTSFELEKIKEISYRAAWWNGGGQTTGANLLDMIRSQLYRSLATNNVTGIEQGFSRIWEDIAVLPLGGQGIQSDWSYHFHGYQLLAGSYGIGWVDNVFLYMLCSDSTQYQVDQQHLLVFGEFLTKGDAWMIIGTNWDWNVVGRSISRPFDISTVDIEPDWMRLLARSIDNNDTKIELMNFADRLDEKPNASPLIGNKHFYTSDYQVHRRTNWTTAIKMQSIRTQGSECTNGENRRDEHGGQGVLNLYIADKNDYNFVFPLLDWQAINGITVEHGIPLEPCIYSEFSVIKLPFVGGVSDGQYGLAMMNTASHNLTAKRSWHFYDDAIIALATNLTLTTPTAAWTTLASRLLPTGKVSIGFLNSTVITLNDGNYSFPHVQWIHLSDSNIGYVLPLEQQYGSVGIQVGTVTGNYNTINIYNHPVTARTVTLYIDHGMGPYTNLDYNYMILPNVSLESMPTLIKQYTEEQVFACISTNQLFHGTMWPTLKRASFVLWDNVTTTFSCKSPTFEINIELSDAGAYLYSESETDFTLTASHPIRVNGVLKATVDRVGSGTGCVASSSIDVTKTDVALTLPSSPQLLGASVNVTCKK